MRKIIFSIFLSVLMLGAWLFSGGQAADDRQDTLIIGVPPNAAPLSFLNDERTGLLGLAVDLSKMMGQALNKNVAFIQSNARKLEQRLERGEIDALVGLLPVNLQNDFSDVLVTPLALNRAILVAGPTFQFHMEADLAGYRVILVRGDTYRERLEKLGCTIISADSISNALNRLTNGEAEAYVTSSVEMAFHVVQRKGYKSIRTMGSSLERIPMVMMVGKKSDMAERMTSALVKLEESGEVEKLRTKWLGRMLSVPTVWETYRFYILGGLALIIFLCLISLAWIHTLRKQVRRISTRLRRSERKYRDLIEESPDIILLLDESGTITICNRAARKALNITPPAQSDMLLKALSCQSADCLDRFIQIIPSQGSLRREISLALDTGKELILEVNLFLTEVEDSYFSICLIGRDITARRKLDHQVMEMERLAVLGKLAAGVAHEINNPIGIIKANAELAIEDCEDSSPMKAMLKAIHRNCERAVSTTRRLMNIALPSTVQHEPQNIAQLTREALFFLKPRMKSVKVDCSGLPSELFVSGSRVLLEQLVLNLLINALDSMDNLEKPALVIEGRCTEAGIQISFADVGCGICEENVEKVFTPFFSSKNGKGFGLGLYISQHIVKQHDGHIAIESEVDQGTTVMLGFPAMSDSYLKTVEN